MAATLGGRLPKRSQHHETQDDEIWVDWLPCAEGAIETLAPELGSQRPGDTTTPACFGYTLGSSDSQTTSDGKTFIVCTYRKPKRMDSNATLSEVSQTSGWGYRGKPHLKRGTRVFITPDASSEVVVANGLPPYALWPSDSGLWPRKVIDIQIERNWRKGLARVVVQYGVPPLSPWIESNPGKGILGIRIGNEQRTLKYDLDGLPIEAEDGDANGRFRWVLRSGSNVVLSGTAILVVRAMVTNSTDARTVFSQMIGGTYNYMTALNSENDITAFIARWAGLVGKYNSAACPNIGGAAAKTLMFLGVEPKSLQGFTKGFLADFHLAYDGAGWDKSCKAQKENYQVREVAVRDEAGNVLTGNAAAKSRTGTWVPDAEEIEDRKVVEAGDFSILNGYLS